MGVREKKRSGGDKVQFWGIAEEHGQTRDRD